MSSRELNPWSWQEGFGFSHGVEMAGPKRVVEVSGQCATGPDGAPQHTGDMGAQIALAMQNVEAVLKAAEMDLSNVVRLRVFATDVQAALENWGNVTGPVNAVGSRPSSTLVGTTGLFSPDLMVEIEATAME